MPLVNHFNRTVDALAPTTSSPRLKALAGFKHPDLGSYSSSQLWPWVWSYLKYTFTKKAKFPTYQNARKDGLYCVPPTDIIRIAIAGDWGTGTDQAFNIAKLISQTNPDYTIHLGDVYYVGDLPEIEEKCLGQPRDGFDGISWPKGAKGSFALNGNHEMYTNGGPYFTTF